MKTIATFRLNHEGEKFALSTDGKRAVMDTFIGGYGCYDVRRHEGGVYRFIAVKVGFVSDRRSAFAFLKGEAVKMLPPTLGGIFNLLSGGRR